MHPASSATQAVHSWGSDTLVTALASSVYGMRLRLGVHDRAERVDERAQPGRRVAKRAADVQVLGGVLVVADVLVPSAVELVADEPRDDGRVARDAQPRLHARTQQCAISAARATVGRVQHTPRSEECTLAVWRVRARCEPALPTGESSAVPISYTETTTMRRA